LVVAVLLVLAAAVGRWLVSDGGRTGAAGGGADAGAKASAQRRIAAATFVCDGGKTIAATFYASTGRSAARKDEPPAPGGSVHLELSDGRVLDLPQTISASGARYAGASESIVFWNRGNGAFVTEQAGARGENSQTYSGCITVGPDPGGLPEVYESGAAGFSIRYPRGYTVDPAYEYQALGPDTAIPGVKLTIAPAIAAGTNLAADSYLSVEQIERGESCTASRFVASGAAATAVTDAGTTYSVAHSMDAGAGNRYEETVYALLGSDPCLAVRYFIHYGVLENYPAGAVRAFDRQGLLAQFDAIRRTLIVAR
jgi:membrane-bound inhibitor of C-type lysozyme